MLFVQCVFIVSTINLEENKRNLEIPCIYIVYMLPIRLSDYISFGLSIGSQLKQFKTAANRLKIFLRK